MPSRVLYVAPCHSSGAVGAVCVVGAVVVVSAAALASKYRALRLSNLCWYMLNESVDLLAAAWLLLWPAQYDKLPSVNIALMNTNKLMTFMWNVFKWLVRAAGAACHPRGYVLPAVALFLPSVSVICGIVQALSGAVLVACFLRYGFGLFDGLRAVVAVLLL